MAEFIRILRQYKPEYYDLIRILHKLKKKARRQSLKFLKQYHKSQNKDRYAMTRSATWEVAAQLIENEMEGFRLP